MRPLVLRNEGSIFRRKDGRWAALVNVGWVDGKRARKSYCGSTRKEVQEQLTKALSDTGAHVRCVGKGRKERCTPLAKTTVAVLKAWLREPAKHNTDVSFPSANGGRLSSDSVADLLAKHVAIARKSCPSLRKKHVTPHVLRHSMAMGLLQAGVDRAVIALWLGHESVETTQIYLEANLAMKEEILAKTTPPNGKPGRYRPGDELLAFLSSL